MSASLLPSPRSRRSWGSRGCTEREGWGGLCFPAGTVLGAWRGAMFNAHIPLSGFLRPSGKSPSWSTNPEIGFSDTLSPRLPCSHLVCSLLPKANKEPAPLVHIQVCSLRGFGWRSLAPGHFPGGSGAKNLPPMQETGVQSLGWEDPLGEAMVTHSRILAWRIPWTEETGGLQSMGSQRVGHD